MSSPKLLLIDNYDSFTYNLVQAFLVLGAEVLVHRNDQITLSQAEALKPTHLCISPVPGTPHDAGVSMQMIEHFAGKTPAPLVRSCRSVAPPQLATAQSAGRPAGSALRRLLSDRRRAKRFPHLPAAKG